MIKREFLELISSLNFWSREQETGVPRGEYTGKVHKYSEAGGIATAIIGARRAGKTYVAKQFLKELIEKGIAKEQTLYVNFEEPLLEPHLNTEFLESLYDTYRHFLNKDKPAFVVLDEVQAVPRWEKWVRIMLERNEKVKLIITGSSSKLLSSELATVLTGRALPVEVFPLRFNEFLDFSGMGTAKKGAIGQKKAIIEALHTYIEYGGFPPVVLARDREVKLGILKEILDGIITKDIAWRHNVRRVGELKLLAVLALQNFSSQVSVKRLSDIMQNAAKRRASPTTINSFLYYFSEAFLFAYIPIFSHKIKEQALYPKKLYCIDTGLINVASPRFSENTGRLAENLVAIELVKRHGIENISYWKDTQQREVDFAIKDGLKVRQLVQVCWNVGSKETRKRELNSLLAAMNEFKLKTGLILTEDHEGQKKAEGKRIAYTPLWKWLLQPVYF